MSRLIYKGDTINNFGKHLPTPYIDRVIVYDEKLEITVSLFINAPENDKDDIIDWIEDRIYLNIVTMNSLSEDELEDFTSGEMNCIQFIADGIPSSKANMAQWGEFFSDHAGNTTIVYDDEGNRYLKITKEETFTVDTTTESGLESLSDTTLSVNTFDIITSAALYKSDNFYIGFFTSIDEHATFDISTNTEQTNNLIAKNISDMAFEKITEDGDLPPQKEILWVDPEGDPYGLIPLQNLTSQYYTAENITHQDIVDSFQELLDEYETETETYPKLKKMVDNISYILAKYGKTFQLLPQLNLLRKVFSSKTAATPVGKLYVSFRKRIYNANLAIEQEKRLLKKIVTNAKIIDAREMGEEIFDPTGPIDYDDDEILYDKWYCHAEAIKIVEEPEEYEDYNTSVYGIFFFDYEKIVNSCYVANIFDIDKLVTWFGRELIQAFLYPTSATITSYRAPSVDGDYTDAGATKNLSIEATNDDTPKTVYNEILEYESSNSIDNFTDLNGNDRYSYLQLRNFTPVLPTTTWNDYRLMCFEFQELIEGFITGGSIESGPSDDDPRYLRYVAQVTVKDSTVDIARFLWKIVSRYYKLLEVYLANALEKCAFNDIDGKYNQFFIDAMEEKYADTPETAPWNIAPIVYNILRDIGFDTFGGNYADILAASLEISTKISPFTGVIWELEAFVIKFDELLNDTFGSDTDSESSSPGYWIWYDVSSVADSVLGVSYEETTYTNELSIDDIPAVVYGWDGDGDADEDGDGGGDFFASAATPTHGATKATLSSGVYDGYIESYKEYADAVETVIGNFENKCDTAGDDEVQIENAYDKAILLLLRVGVYLGAAAATLEGHYDDDAGDLEDAIELLETADVAVDDSWFGDNFGSEAYSGTRFVCTIAFGSLEQAIQELLDSYVVVFKLLDDIADDIYTA